MLIAIGYKAEKRNNRNIRVAGIKNLVRIAVYNNSGLKTELGNVADVLADKLRVNVYCTDYLHTLFIKITDNVFRHFSAAVLHCSDFFHNNLSSNELFYYIPPKYPI